MFKLSTKIRYGTRAIVRIAAYGNAKAVSLNDVSCEEEISHKYLENIISALKKNGLVRSVKGPKGGYILSRPMEEITLLDIARALEGNMFLVDCCEQGVECHRKDICSTYETWFEMSHIMQNAMQSVTLKELVKKDGIRLKKKTKKKQVRRIKNG